MYGRKIPTFCVMTRVGVHNNEFCNLALEERFYRIQTADFDEFCPESSTHQNSVIWNLTGLFHISGTHFQHHHLPLPLVDAIATQVRPGDP
jgi:hypothetical protein